MNPTAPVTKTARQARIAAILAHEQVRSQEELAELLERYASVHVTQATLSRDLDELGVVRLRAAGGALVYALPEEPGGPGSRPGGPMTPGGPVTSGGPVTPGRRAVSAPPAASENPAPTPSGSAKHGKPGAAEQGAKATGHESPHDARLARYLGELMTSAEASANLVVLRTPAGAAQFLASVIDHAALSSILGTVAGDDTVLIITRDPAGGDAVAADFLRRSQRRR
jgi:transcriptional regulator of arginine metabolism